MCIRDSIIEDPIKRYRKALKVLPNDPDLHFKIGLYFFITDDFHKTLNHFNESTRLRPEDARTHYFTALIHHLMGNGVNAINHMKRAEEFFIGSKETKSIADVRKHLRVYKSQYGISTIQGDGSSIARTTHQQQIYD